MTINPGDRVILKEPMTVSDVLPSTMCGDTVCTAETIEYEHKFTVVEPQPLELWGVFVKGDGNSSCWVATSIREHADNLAADVGSKVVRLTAFIHKEEVRTTSILITPNLSRDGWNDRSHRREPK